MANDFGDVNRNLILSDAVPLESQVAGHTFTKGSSKGMLSHKDGYVLKPVLDEKGEREVKFYEEIQSCPDPFVKELKKFAPRYYGTTNLKLGKEDTKWIVLGNISHMFEQPCIMDIKIGVQTWDPLATEEKRLSEEKKYKESKRDVGFCIPGFQVYQLSTGKLLKFDREYGKTLNGETVRSSLATFLNADFGLSRSLVLQILTKLWKILRWFRTQKKYKFYSSSLLLAYDAVRLRRNRGPISRVQFGYGAVEEVSRPSSPPSSPPRENWHSVFDKVCQNHSLVNNYDKDLQTKKEDYNAQLRDLLKLRAEDPGGIWSSVYMIDFAHVFHSNPEELDKNYLNGLENLVNIFEGFLLQASY